MIEDLSINRTLTLWKCVPIKNLPWWFPNKYHKTFHHRLESLWFVHNELQEHCQLRQLGFLGLWNERSIWGLASCLDVEWQGQHVDTAIVKAAKTSADETQKKSSLCLNQRHTQTAGTQARSVFHFDPPFMMRGTADKCSDSPVLVTLTMMNWVRIRSAWLHVPQSQKKHTGSFLFRKVLIFCLIQAAHATSEKVKWSHDNELEMHLREAENRESGHAAFLLFIPASAAMAAKQS